jgi:hypothetical protein
MATVSTYDKVSRLIQFATGEPYGDGEVVTDVMVGYAEPGYPSDPDVVIVLGNYNPRHISGQDRWSSDDPRVTMPVRLARSLERVGAELEWSDEWTQCQGCFRAVRTTENSYSWRPSFLWTDGGAVCHECAIKDGEDAFTGYGDDDESYINNAGKCVTWCDPLHVESFGFIKWEANAPHTYENGWHPGQTDDPADILAGIHAAQPGRRGSLLPGRVVTVLHPLQRLRSHVLD